MAAYAIAIDQGTTFSLVVTWKDPTGALVNLTGYTAKLHVVDNLSNRVSLLEFNSVSGGSSGTSLVLGGAAGTVTVGLTATASAGLTFSAGTYTLMVSSSGGTITRLLAGDFTVSPGLGY